MQLKNVTRFSSPLVLKTLILCSLFHTMRTMGIGRSGESGESSSSFAMYQPQQHQSGSRSHHHDSDLHHHPRAMLSPPPTESSSSSLENSVQYQQLSRQRRGHHHHHASNNNAIVRASVASGAQRHSSNSHAQFNFARSEGASGCPTCGAAQQNIQTANELSNTIPDREETLRRMRLEMIKQQILKKLRLKEPPKAVGRQDNNLPSPIILGDTLPKRSESESDRDVEDFYGKTEQVIVFPQDEGVKCRPDSSNPSSCFGFKLPREIRYEEIGNVELWAFKLPDPNDGKGDQSFYVRQLAKRTSSSSSDEPADGGDYIVRENTGSQMKGWISLNVTSVVVEWMRRGEFEKTLEVGCLTCAQFDEESGEDLGSPIGTEGEDRPFLVFNMAGMVRKKRSRRHINCTPNITDCCRERFVVDFKEIGWDWIIGPQSYDAFYCKGSCSLSSSASRRGSILARYLNMRDANNQTAELVPCCTATRMSSISLAYNDWGNYNSSVPRRRTETLPNMVVESCGCF